MTTFVLSHNLQITSDSVPAIDMQNLAEALVVISSSITLFRIVSKIFFDFDNSSSSILGLPALLSVQHASGAMEVQRRLGRAGSCVVFVVYLQVI